MILEADIIGAIPEYLGRKGILRSRNPNLVVLAYFSTGDIEPTAPFEPIVERFTQQLQPKWYMRDVNGKEILLFEHAPNHWTRLQNHTTRINRFLPRYVNRSMLQTGLLDGVFYDWATPSIAWLNYLPRGYGRIDIDNDGKPDSDQKIDKLWQRGYTKMLSKSRKLFPRRTVIVGNGGGPQYAEYLNGMMIEQFLEDVKEDEKDLAWTEAMRNYAHYDRVAPIPRFSVILAVDDDPQNFQEMRFGLASTLMFDGYFSFTNKTKPSKAYQTAWWYDEYSVDFKTGAAKHDPVHKGYLGQPSGPATDAHYPLETLRQVLERAHWNAAKRVWRRDFDNGIVLVNPSNHTHTVELRGTFRKIRGVVDPEFNDGSRTDRIEMAPRTGIILLRQQPSVM